MKIILIDGPSGSGKTTLCRELSKKKYIKCYDTDDITSSCFFEIYKKNKKENVKFWKCVEKLVNDKVSNIYKKHKNDKTKLLIFSGSQNLPHFIYNLNSHFFIIKIKDYKKSYQLRIKRDYEKLVNNKNKINKYITKEPVENIMTIINHGLMINTELPHYNQWKKNIKNYYKMVKTQWNINSIYTYENILDKILNIYNH